MKLSSLICLTALAVSGCSAAIPQNKMADYDAICSNHGKVGGLLFGDILQCTDGMQIGLDKKP